MSPKTPEQTIQEAIAEVCEEMGVLPSVAYRLTAVLEHRWEAAELALVERIAAAYDALAAELADVKKAWSDDTRDIGEMERQRDALAEALRTIQEWDCLNPPTMHLCTDFPWLKRLVDAALEGLQNPLKPLVGVEDEPGVLDEREAPHG